MSGLASVIVHNGQFAVVLYHEDEIEIQPQEGNLNYVVCLARGRAALWGYRFVEPKLSPAARTVSRPQVSVPFFVNSSTDHLDTVNIRKVG